MIETTEEQVINMEKAEQFAGMFINDLSANYSGIMILLGHELGFYKAMDGQEPMTSTELAAKTNTYERYIREWLNSQAAGGYLTYNPENETYALPPENALTLSQEEGPMFMIEGFSVVNSMWHDKEKLGSAFKSGIGIGWHEHNHNLFHGVESIYRSGYRANLNEVCIPSIKRMDEILQKGGRVADVGCGHGASTLLMAEKYPNSKFYGFDYHEESIEVARQNTKEKGLDNVQFELTSATI